MISNKNIQSNIMPPGTKLALFIICSLIIAFIIFNYLEYVMFTNDFLNYKNIESIRLSKYIESIKPGDIILFKGHISDIFSIGLYRHNIFNDVCIVDNNLNLLFYDRIEPLEYLSSNDNFVFYVTTINTDEPVYIQDVIIQPETNELKRIQRLITHHSQFDSLFPFEYTARVLLASEITYLPYSKMSRDIQSTILTNLSNIGLYNHLKRVIVT
jgi:hypothetical protein